MESDVYLNVSSMTSEPTQTSCNKSCRAIRMYLIYFADICLHVPTAQVFTKAVKGVERQEYFYPSFLYLQSNYYATSRLSSFFSLVI